MNTGGSDNADGLRRQTLSTMSLTLRRLPYV